MALNEPGTAAGPRRWPAIAAIAAVAAWASLAVLIGRMYASSPPGAGFDLELLLTGGRRVAAGLSPYEPAMLAGQSVGITTLFYSYPPLVAQAFAPFAAIPSSVMFATLLVVAPLTAAAILVAVARLYTPIERRDAFLVALAFLPFWFPFMLGMLFGNIDLLFVALYGLVLVAVARPEPSRGTVVAAGAALGVASLTKLHPAVLGVWLLARGARELRRRETPVALVGVHLPRSWAVAAVAVVVVLVVLAASLLVGGTGPWLDYVTVLRASAVVDLLDPRNLGPAVQVALALGLDASALGPMQAVVVAVALLVAVWSALGVDDPVESLLWATFASIVPLPVTWFHHFGVLLPFGAAALARGWSAGPKTRRRMAILVILSLAVAGLGFARVTAWLLLPLSIALVRTSRSPAEPDQAVASTVARAG